MNARARRRWPWVVLALLAVLVALRVALPSVIEREVNARLDRMGEYHGELAGIDLHLWRGAYTIEGLRIVRRNAKAPPLLDAPRLDLSVKWRALLEGGIVANATFHRPEINFVDGSLRDNGGGVDWREQLESLMPFRLDEVRVFVSHAFEPSDDYHRVFEYLESSHNFYYRNCSNPELQLGGSSEAMKDELRKQINLAEVVIVPAALYTRHR